MLWRYCLACRCFEPIAIGGEDPFEEVILSKGQAARHSGVTVSSRTEQSMLRIILTVLCLAVATPVFAQTSGAENYPNRAVRVVVPFPPGGPTDTYARILADKLQTAL